MHIVLNAIPTHVGGGLSVTLVLADAFRTHIPEAKLTVLTSRQPVDEAVREKFGNDPGVSIRRMAQRLGPLRSFAWQNARLGRELRRVRADVLVGFNHLVERVDCRQVVYHINLRRFSTDFRDGGLMSRVAESLRDRAARRALLHADANVFESRYLQTCAEQFHPDISIVNPSVVYNGLPEETFVATPDPPTLSPVRLLTLTNPNPHKDCDTLVATLAELVKTRPGVDWRLDIAGGHDPSVWDGVRAGAKSKGVLDRIDFVGFCDADRISKLTARSLCVVSTSRMESFQLVGVEGMARGCPCVVADCASMPESVGDAGLLAEPGNAADFAAKIASLLNPMERVERVQAGLTWTRQFHRDACGRSFAEIVAGVARSEQPAFSRAA